MRKIFGRRNIRQAGIVLIVVGGLCSCRLLLPDVVVRSEPVPWSGSFELPSIDSAPPSNETFVPLLGGRFTRLADLETIPELEQGDGQGASAETRRLELIRSILDERARRLTTKQKARVAQELLAAETKYGLDAILLLALIEQESSFNPKARGPRGAVGLMQVRPFVGKAVAGKQGIPWRGARTLKNPMRNVQIGIHYFAQMKRMYPENTIALAAYNMGPYRVKRMLHHGRIPTPRYVFLVLERYYGMHRSFRMARGTRPIRKAGALQALAQ